MLSRGLEFYDSFSWKMDVFEGVANIVIGWWVSSVGKSLGKGTGFVVGRRIRPYLIVDKSGPKSFYDSDGSRSASSNGRRTKKKAIQSLSVDSSLEGLTTPMQIGDAVDLAESHHTDNVGPYGPIRHSRGRYRRISVTSRRSVRSSPTESLFDGRVQHLGQQLGSVIGRRENMGKLAENMVGQIKNTLENIKNCQTQQDQMIINQNAALTEMKSTAEKLNDTTQFNQMQLQRRAEIMEQQENMSLSIQELTKVAFQQTAMRQKATKKKL